MKYCKKCNITTSDFRPCKKNKDGLFSWCRTCENTYQREHYKADRSVKRSAHLKYKYGITLDEYNELLQQQDNTCAICNKECTVELSVDHCHITGKVRGLLCRVCNTNLAYYERIIHNKSFKDNMEIYLEGAIK